MKRAGLALWLSWAAAAHAQEPNLLYVWAWDADQSSSDFLAVFIYNVAYYANLPSKFLGLSTFGQALNFLVLLPCQSRNPSFHVRA